MRGLVVFALLLLLVGTYLLAEEYFVWDAALYLALALVTLVAAGAWRRPEMRRVKAWIWRAEPRSLGIAVRAGALVLSALVAMASRGRPAAAGFGGLLALWLMALLLFLLTVTRPALGCREVGVRLSGAERWGLAALMVAAFLVRGIAVGRIPANLGGDEGTQLVAALEIVERPLGNPFATGWYSVPTMSFLVYGAAMRLFGETVAGGRMLSVLLGTAGVLATFLLARTISGRFSGWAAAFILAFSSYHIHFSRLASNQVADPLVAAMALWLVWQAMALEGRTDLLGQVRPGWAVRIEGGATMSEGLWGLAGVVAGMGWYAYFGARWVTALIIVVVAWRGLADRTLLRRNWRGLLLFGTGWVVVTLPLWWWYFAHPSSLRERYSAVSVFASGWMDRERLLTGRSVGSLMLQQVWRSVTAFHLTRDPTFWYRPDRPLVDFVTGALVLLGIVDTLGRVRWPSHGLAHLWFWSTVVMAWALTENPPSSQRGLLLLPPVALFAAWGIRGALERLSLPRRAGHALTAALLTAVAVVNVAFYFGTYTPREVYGNPSAQTATRFAAYLATNPEPICELGDAILCDGQVYFLGPPWLYWRFGSLSFLLRGYPGVDVAQGELPVEVTVPARFAVVPERSEQMAEIRSRWPGGAETEIRAPDGRRLMWIYDWTGAD